MAGGAVGGDAVAAEGGGGGRRAEGCGDGVEWGEVDYGAEAEGHAPNVIARSSKSGRLWSLKVLRNTDAIAQAAEEGLPLLRGAGVSGYKCVHEAKNVGRHTGVLHWSAACKVGGALKILGYFPSAEEAAPCSP